MLNLIPIRGPRPKEQVRAASAGQESARGNRQVHVRVPVTFTYNTSERQELQYDQPFAGKGTKSISMKLNMKTKTKTNYNTSRRTRDLSRGQ